MPLYGSDAGLEKNNEGKEWTMWWCEVKRLPEDGKAWSINSQSGWRWARTVCWSGMNKNKTGGDRENEVGEMDRDQLSYGGQSEECGLY